LAVENFFDAQSEASGVKARIIAKYFDAWSTIVLPSAKKYNQKLVYMDLYCGPGRYGDDKKSTPLMILESAIAKPELAKILVTIFNDEDEDAIEKLREEFKKLPGIAKLAHKPDFVKRPVGPNGKRTFGDNILVTFTARKK
jgi:three-Cys-motif partner protein